MRVRWPMESRGPAYRKEGNVDEGFCATLAMSCWVMRTPNWGYSWSKKSHSHWGSTLGCVNSSVSFMSNRAHIFPFSSDGKASRMIRLSWVNHAK
eukprot:scaffold234437_cov71-Attheya_sp.AAC.2